MATSAELRAKAQQLYAQAAKAPADERLAIVLCATALEAESERLEGDAEALPPAHVVSSPKDGGSRDRAYGG